MVTNSPALVKNFEDSLILMDVIHAFISWNCMQVYPEGKMSQHFASLKPGDVVEVKG